MNLEFKDWFLNEIIQPQQGQVSWFGSLRDNGGYKIAKFISNDYIYYILFHAEKEEGIFTEPCWAYQVSFDSFRSGEDSKPMRATYLNRILTTLGGAMYQGDDFARYNSIKTQNPQDVLNKVVGAVQEFITKVKPKLISWKGMNDKLTKIYDRLLQRYRNSDYLVVEMGRGTCLIRKDMAPKFSTFTQRIIAQTQQQV